MLYAMQQCAAIRRTQLMKYVFFVDLFTLNKRGETLLEDTYIRLPNGPVPKYGFEHTALPDGVDSRDDGDFSVHRIRDLHIPDIYWYSFTPKAGSFADINVFSQGERELLRLTLRSVLRRNTYDVVRQTQSYSLWKNHENGEAIGLDEFILKRGELDELERFLGTKVFLSPMRKPLRWRSKKTEPPLIDGFPDHFPVYFNEITGKKMD